MPDTNVTSRSLYGIYLFLILTTLVVYAQVYNFSFVNFDDGAYIYENPYVQGRPLWTSIQWAFTTNAVANWHPITWLSYLVEWRLFGMNAGGYHLVSVLFHVINTLLLFEVLRRMTGATWRSAFVAAVFALHPIHVESVAWISERKDVLSAFFWLLTMGAYLVYVQRPNVGRYVAVCACFALGLMSKPMVVTLPFVLLLLDYWPLNRLAPEAPEPQAAGKKGGKKQKKQRRAPNAYGGMARIILEKVPLLAMSIISSIITFIVQRQGGAVQAEEIFPLSMRLMNATATYVRYIGKTICPKSLIIYYVHLRDTLAWWQFTGAFLILLCITVFAVFVFRRRRYLAVGWLWYLGTLVPVIGIVQAGSQAMADRYTYLPLIGLSIMLAWGVVDLAKERRIPRKAVVGVAAVLVAVLAILTFRQVGHWRNDETLYGHALRCDPTNALGHNNLGRALQSQGKTAEAIAEYEETIRLYPECTAAYTNLGALYAQQGKTDEAIKCHKKALELSPNSKSTRYNLGNALYSQGRYPEALEQYRQGDQTRADVANNIGAALSGLGKLDDAIPYYEKSLRIDSRYANAHFGLGNIYLKRGRNEEAITHFKKGLEVDPTYEPARKALAALGEKVP